MWRAAVFGRRGRLEKVEALEPLAEILPAVQIEIDVDQLGVADADADRARLRRIVADDCLFVARVGAIALGVGYAGQ